MKRLLFIVIPLIGCAQEAVERDSFAVPLVAESADEVVATVDGRPIRAGEVALQARARGCSPKQALEDLVGAEALAGEAARRGLDREREPLQAARAEAVRRLLAHSFEKEVTPEAIPPALVRRVYAENKSVLNHEIQIDVWHLLVGTKNLGDDEKHAARQAAEDLARRAHGIGDAEKFKALAATVRPPFAARFERVVTEKKGWVVPEFSNPAFEQLKQPGDTSSVVETEYGYHVMFLNGFRAAQHIGPVEADAKLRAGLFPEFQKRAFVQFADRVRKDHAVEVFPENLK
jgi:peptidyl-prolyl cis-trans isomerase C